MDKLFRFRYIIWEYKSILLTTMHEHYNFSKWRKIKRIFLIRRRELKKSVNHHISLLNYK